MDLSLLQAEVIRVDDPPPSWKPQYNFSISIFCEPYKEESASARNRRLRESASELIESSEKLKTLFPNVRLALHVFGADLSNFQKCSVSLGTSEVAFEKRIGTLTELLVQHHPAKCVLVSTVIILDHCSGYQYIFVPPPSMDLEDEDVSSQRLFMERFTRVKEPVPTPDPDEVSSARLQSETTEGLEMLIREMEQWAKEKGLQILHKSFNRDKTVVDVYFYLAIRRSVF